MWITKEKAQTQIKITEQTFDEFLSSSGFDGGVIEKIFPYSKMTITDDGERVELWQWETQTEVYTFSKSDPPIPLFAVRVRLKISYIPERRWKDWWVVDYTIYP